MPSLDLTAIDYEYLFDLLFLPACILIVALSAGIIVNRFVNNYIAQHTESFYPEDDNVTGNLKTVFINALRGVPISFCLVAGIYWIVNTVNLPPSVVKIFSYILFTVNAFTLTRVLARGISGFVTLQLNKGGQLPKTSLLNNILNVIIYAMGIIIILQYYGISVTPIITAMGVGGMAVALGMQETLANIFSGVHLIISKQLRLNDYIRLSSGEEGQVTDITWRFTTITSLLGNVVVIPNQKLASAVITNYNMPIKDITVRVTVGVSYDSDLQKVEDVTLDVANKVAQKMRDTGKSIAGDLPPAVRFHTFGDSSINFDVFLHSSQFNHQAELKHEFIKALTARYRQEGIEIPFPIRTIITNREER